jgi:Fe-S-cluster containining protein
MKSCCIDYKCVQCCLETEMLLSNEDMERIRGLGFAPEFFITKRDGRLQLKNYNGRCVFQNGIGCSIYKNRPEGCRLYPIIYDEEKNCAVLDEDCPHRDKFEISKTSIQQVSDLASKLECERTQRKQSAAISLSNKK